MGSDKDFKFAKGCHNKVFKRIDGLKGKVILRSLSLFLYPLMLLPLFSFGQKQVAYFPDSIFSTYYHQKITQFRLLPYAAGETIFLGNSITDGGDWNEIFRNSHIINRGISGDITVGVLNRMDEIIRRKPAKVFLLIGINDLARGIAPDSMLSNIEQIVLLLHEGSPGTQVYVQSIFPVNKTLGKFPNHVNKKAQIIYINKELQEKAEEKNFIFINVFNALKDRDGDLDLQYTNDGLHLLGAGYMVWKHIIYPYVYNLQEKPALIPLPQQMKWTNNLFPLYSCKTIVITDSSLKSVAEQLQKMLHRKGLIVNIEGNSRNIKSPKIILKIGKMQTSGQANESYGLDVNNTAITISANNAHGVFNGVQTLRQLMRDNVFIDGCQITDWPSFPWRGYMIDVGRNFQTLKQIKEQIGVMAQYKLNIFHFHLTENVAWRLQVKRYPQLTDQQFMTRNKGQYYTIGEMQELIRYCKERFITLIPEIDMPGHSDAFTRATGVNMQSDEGLQIMKNILAEVDSTYDIPYLHIGADEVKFTNNNFIPEVVNLIHQQGKQTIGWAPGGNYDYKTIRQLWQSEGPPENHKSNEMIRYIDSRDLYLNHMDPLSGVVSIFNREIGGVIKGNESVLGGEICLWNDDRAKDEKDILCMNLAYPAILAFSERSWRGGGYDGFLTDLGPATSERYKAFAAFEKRLIDHKTEFFKHKPFPYQPQADIQWKLLGPFQNNGKLSTEFWPENNPGALEDSPAKLIVNGGTVWLRHFFAPLVSGAIQNPDTNSTWYAYRKIYSPVDTMGYFWISFYNPSRSHAVWTAPEGHWDRRESKIWINGKAITPPQWTYPGRDGTQDDPLVDESYEYRSPTAVHLRKGSNTILVKAPVGTFKGKSWQHPVKWMFTVVQVKD